MLPVMAEANDDTQLMTRYVAGDVVAFEALYARHKGPLYRYFFRQCGNPDHADELFQAVWVRLIKSGARPDSIVPFNVHIFQIAHRCLAEHIGKLGSSLTDAANEPETEAVSGAAAEEADPAFASARWSLVDWEQGPEDSSPGSEAANSVEQRSARLQAALDTLPVEQREAFLLHEEAELGLADIGAVTGANAATVKSRLGDAVKKLRGALGGPAPAAASRALS